MATFNPSTFFTGSFFAEAGASTDATATIVGLATTSNTGVISAKGSASYTMAGVSSTSSIGVIVATAGSTSTVTGMSTVSNVGSIAPTGSASKTLTSIATTSASGLIAASASVLYSITGVTSTSTIGAITATGGGRATLAGISTSSNAGSINPAGTASIVITGVTTSSNTGVITPAASAVKVLLGLTTASAIGTIVAYAQADATATIIGLQTTSAVGIITPSVYVDATATILGLVTASNTGVIAPTGTANGNIVIPSTNSSVGLVLGEASALFEMSGVSTTSTIGVIEAVGTDFITDIWNYPIDGIYTIGDMMKMLAGVMGGKVSGAKTSTITFRNINDTEDAIIANVDDKGNRLSITATPSIPYKLTESAAAVWNTKLDGDYTALDLLKIISASAMGKVTGADTALVTFRDTHDTTDRIIAVTDKEGDRLGVTYVL